VNLAPGLDPGGYSWIWPPFLSYAVPFHAVIYTVRSYAVMRMMWSTAFSETAHLCLLHTLCHYPHTYSLLALVKACAVMGKSQSDLT